MFLQFSESAAEREQDLVEDAKTYQKIHVSSDKNLRRLLRELQSDWMGNEVECSVDSMFCNMIVFRLSSYEVTNVNCNTIYVFQNKTKDTQEYLCGRIVSFQLETVTMKLLNSQVASPIAVSTLNSSGKGVSSQNHHHMET